MALLDNGASDSKGQMTYGGYPRNASAISRLHNPSIRDFMGTEQRLAPPIIEDFKFGSGSNET